MTTRAELVRTLRSAVIPQLRVLVARDLDVPAGELAKTCAEILQHIAWMPFIWASRISTRSQENDYIAHAGPTDDNPRAVLGTLDAGLAVFADVLSVMPASALAAHSAGLADSLAWAAMISDEVLIHSWDIAQGVGGDFAMPEELCQAVLDRLFPWAGSDYSLSERLLWVNGRQPLGDRPPIRDWVWHCEDLSRWDGTIPSDKTLQFLPTKRREIGVRRTPEPVLHMSSDGAAGGQQLG